MSHLIVHPGPDFATVLEIVPEPATISVGLSATCEVCGGSISATNSTDVTRCYWCANPHIAAACRVVRTPARVAVSA